MTDNEIFVDVLTNPDTNWKEIAVKIAKENPEVFIASLKSSIVEPEYMKQIRALIKGNRKVDAIKLYRESQGMMKGTDGNDCFKGGWKESKDAVEALMQKMADNATRETNE